eukprot:760279-Hanusia_phi.AAC.1
MLAMTTGREEGEKGEEVAGRGVGEGEREKQEECAKKRIWFSCGGLATRANGSPPAAVSTAADAIRKESRPKGPPRVISLLGTRAANYKHAEDPRLLARQPPET